MFHAVRQWWDSGRGRSTARLFGFEFLVVMAGVLAAQALADWHSHRLSLAAMEDAREKADRDVAFHYAVAVGWKRAVPCLDQRMSLLMQQLATEKPIDPELLKRPAMEGGNLQLPSENQRLLIAERYGPDRAQDYWAASQNVTKLSNNVTDIIRGWSGFAMVDPANGPISAEDRHDARLAASSVKEGLRGLDITAGNIIGRAEALGLKPDSLGEFRLIDNCDDLWRNRMTHPNTGTK
jgi:hypothetical protein